MLEWIYNRNGRAVALNCDDCVFDSNGCFRLWKWENNLYNMNGNHVGWVEGGVFYDSQNRVLGFTRDHSKSLPSTPGICGTPGYPGISGKPSRPGFSGVPGRPGYSEWSTILMEDYIIK